MMEITQLLNSNRLPRKQKGQRFETDRAFFLRYYHTTEDGKRRQKAILLAYKSDHYRSWNDVEPLVEAERKRINAQAENTIPTGRVALSDFVEKEYLPWCQANKSAPTANGYKRVREVNLKPHLGEITLTSLTTAQVTAVLTKHAKDGKGSRTLSHIKWMLSGVYVYAISSGIVPKNPVPDAKWLVKVARPKRQAEYSLETVLSMLRI